MTNMEKVMSKIMLFSQNDEQVAVPASEILVKSAGFDVIDETLC